MYLPKVEFQDKYMPQRGYVNIQQQQKCANEQSCEIFFNTRSPKSNTTNDDVFNQLFLRCSEFCSYRLPSRGDPWKFNTVDSD